MPAKGSKMAISVLLFPAGMKNEVEHVQQDADTEFFTAALTTTADIKTVLPDRDVEECTQVEVMVMAKVRVMDMVTDTDAVVVSAWAGEWAGNSCLKIVLSVIASPENFSGEVQDISYCLTELYFYQNLLFAMKTLVVN